MKAFIFLAHGSRRKKSNDEVRRMVDEIAPGLAPVYDPIIPAFLEIEPPSLSDAIESALGQGAAAVTVYPYFLNSGNHVDIDIPRIISGFKLENPQCEFILLPHFGDASEIPALILDQIARSSVSSND